MEPTVLNERYRLVELIGAGGMATVYRGEDLLLERSVAIKFLREPYAGDPAAQKRFLGEARSAAKLDHPNIVHIYDVGQDDVSRPYIVMELVRGEDLKSTIRRDAPLSVTRALKIASAICAGVGHAHRMGTVHCDLKPQNILVTDDGNVKVTDFGIARAVRQDEADQEPAEVVWGSPHYLSPEQARGQTPLPASDVYSVGVILYEMLTGVPPFHDPDPTVLAMKHCREMPPPLTALNPRIPPGLDWLVSKMLSKEPSHRYRNGDQLAMALEEYQRQGLHGTRPQRPVADETPVVAARAGETPVRLTDRTSDRVTNGADAPQTRVTSLANGDGTQPVAAALGNDMTLWMLILIAAIAVVGLVPLWLLVVQAYSAPGVVPTVLPGEATSIPTSDPEALVTVPNLAGLSAADAQRLVQGLNLTLGVAGEEETMEARPGAVVAQTPSAGVRVPEASVVNVIVAAGRPLTMPDVVGYDLASVRAGLESEGMLLELLEVRAPETQGVILAQQPEADQPLRAGDTVTLTVSGGGNVPIRLAVDLDGKVLLEQAWVSQFTYRSGDSVPVTLRWRSLAPLDRSYKVFVHILTQDMGVLVAQRDEIPVNGLRPTTSWTPGEIVNDPHQVALPDGISAGVYQVRVGLYDDSGRLPVRDPGDAQVVDDTIFVTMITVR